MKRILTYLFAIALTLVANAKVDIDISSRFEEGTTTINCTSSWGWYSVSLGNYEIEKCDYLYIKYDASCNFNLILQDSNWETVYSVTCNAETTEDFIQLTGTKELGSIVIQNHSEGQISINKLYFCTEEEYYNPAPDNLEEARQNLIDIYTRYLSCLEDFKVGDEFGMYPAEQYQAFVEAMNAALILDTDEGKNLTVEQLNAMSQAIVDAYKALVASKRLYLPADGYYRIICARQFYKEAENGDVSYFTKAMFSDNTGTNGWKTVDDSNPAFLWTLERQPDNTYILRNAANNLVLTEAGRCTEEEKFISIDPISKEDGEYTFSWTLNTEEDVVVFNFRMSTDPANDNKYIHADWHDGGKGESGPMTVWCNTSNDSGASEWYLKPVDETVAQELLNFENYGVKFAKMLADAKEKVSIANDIIREKLITEASQFSSPYNQNDTEKHDGGSLNEGVLIDGSSSTFWHSVWSNGNVEPGVHYLQIEFPEEIGGDIEFVFSRRKTSSDQVTKWSIYGSDFSDGDKFDCEWIADLETPYKESEESLTTRFSIEEGNKYQYLRFYAEETNSKRGYWHLSEFQLYSLQDNPTNQASNMGEIYTNMVAAIKEAESVNPNAVSKEDYEALKTAYDSFMAVFVDPAPLRKAIEAAEPALALCEVGSNPGQWSQETINTLNKNLQDAKQYDKSGKYIQEQSDAYVELLGDGKSVVLASANKVSPEKYYAIGFASEDKYEEQGWNTGNVVSNTWGDLFDTYLCPAEVDTEKATFRPLPASEVRQGSYMFFTDDAKTDVAFRFIPVGDNSYIIQHQATGLFIHCYGHDSWTGLTLVPTLFTVEAVGYGENIIRGVNYAGKDMACLHAQLDQHRLVTWHDDYAGCNSGLIIEEIDADVVGSPLADYKSGEVTTMCYPVSVQPSEGSLYAVAGTYTANDKVYVAMNKVEKAEAGQPVVYIAKGVYDEENEEDISTISLTIGTDVVTTPQNDGALQGTYEDVDLTSDAIIFRGDKCEMSTEETARVYANHAYVVPDDKADASGSYSLVLEVGATIDGISKALSDVSCQGDVFDMSGRLVKSKATLNDVHSLSHGIYILNGIKILVK